MSLQTPTPSLPRISLLEKYPDRDVGGLTKPPHLQPTTPRRSAAGATSPAIKLRAYELMDIANAAAGKRIEPPTPAPVAAPTEPPAAPPVVLEPVLPAFSPELLAAMRRERTQLLNRRAAIDHAVAAIDCLLQGAP